MQKWEERFANQVVEWRNGGVSVRPSPTLEDSNEFTAWYRAANLGRLHLGERPLVRKILLMLFCFVLLILTQDFVHQSELHTRIQYSEDA